MSLGTRLRKFRKEAGMTQRELAEEIGVTESAVRNYELGYRNPNKANLAALAKTLGVTEEALSNMGPETARGALEMLFRMEDNLGLKLIDTDQGLAIAVDPSVEGSQKFSQALKAWKRKKDALEASELSGADYEAWKLSFKG